MKRRWPITMMCEVLEISPSGYFSWEASQRRPAKGQGRSHSDEALLAHIKAIHEQLRGEYGWPRMHKKVSIRFGAHCNEGLRRRARVRNVEQRTHP